MAASKAAAAATAAASHNTVRAPYCVPSAPPNKAPANVAPWPALRMPASARAISAAGTAVRSADARGYGYTVFGKVVGGMDVVTKIAKSVKNTGIADKISHRKVVIPGHVAVLMGELEEELPGWQIKVGPREAVDLPRYLKTAW